MRPEGRQIPECNPSSPASPRTRHGTRAGREADTARALESAASDTRHGMPNGFCQSPSRKALFGTGEGLNRAASCTSKWDPGTCQASSYLAGTFKAPMLPNTAASATAPKALMGLVRLPKVRKWLSLLKLVTAAVSRSRTRFSTLPAWILI